MWHFIIEIPEAAITEMVVWQRLFITLCMDYFRDHVERHISLRRLGDDIMVNNRKLSVSIATLSQFSGLIHVGINNDVGDKCPVNAIGLNDFCPVHTGTFGGNIAESFVEEYNDVKDATYKVIGV